MASESNGSSTGEVEAETVDSFTNDSAMMIAWERALESKRPDALFSDPLAEALAGTKGEVLSNNFGDMSQVFGFEDWREFHRSWVAVRTRFIDDRIKQHCAAGSLAQVVNLGAGMDTRPYRLDCYADFVNGAFGIDMEVINEGKRKALALVRAPSPLCASHDVDLDFLDEEKTIASALSTAESRFDMGAPTLFVAEGLIMYLGSKGKLKLIADTSAVAAPGSIFILQFMDASKSEAAKQNPSTLDHALSVEEATRELTRHGWEDLEFSVFGDETLNYGRFPVERFQPSASFSFCVCRKGAAI